MAASSCLNCSRMKDELLLLRHQLANRRNTANAAAPSIDATPMPPLLYQLQKNVPKPIPTSITSLVSTKRPIVRPPPPARSPIHSPPPIEEKVKAPKTMKVVEVAPPPRPVTATMSTQTRVDDLEAGAVQGPGCERCICCELAHQSHSTFIDVRDEWRRKYEDAMLVNQRQELEIGQLMTKLRALRGELQQQQQQAALPPPKPSTQTQEQEKLIRLLRQQHSVDQQLLERLQLQVNQLQRELSSTHRSNNSHLDGLSALQRQQLELRSHTEAALLRLQQLFPNQQIGT